MRYLEGYISENIWLFGYLDYARYYLTPFCVSISAIFQKENKFKNIYKRHRTQGEMPIFTGKVWRDG
jgi:hypothetical protein